jgi:hypothetical protein
VSNAPDKAVAVPVTVASIKINPKVQTKASQQLAARWIEEANAAVEALTRLKELQGDFVGARAVNIECALDIAKQAVALGPLFVAESGTAVTMIEAPAKQPDDDGLDIPDWLRRVPKGDTS